MFPFKDENPTVHRGWVTYVLIAINVFVFIFVTNAADPGSEQVETTIEYAAIPCELTEGRPLTEDELLATFTEDAFRADACNLNGDAADPPYVADKQVLLAVVFSMFMHAGLSHIGGNMLFLWIFGNNIEDRFGPVRYLIFYLLGGVAATIAHVLGDPSSTVPVVGASGAIAAVMGAYLIWYPDAPIRAFIFLMIKDIKAKWWLAFWFVSQFFIGSGSGVAWLAHVGGFVFGVAVAAAVRFLPACRKLCFTKYYRDLDHWDNTGGIGRGPYPEFTRVQDTRSS